MIYAELCAAFGLCVNALLFARAVAVAEKHELSLRCMTPFALSALFAGTVAQGVAGSEHSGAHAVATIVLIGLVTVCAVTDAQTGYVFDALTLPSMFILLALALPDRALLSALLGIAAAGGALAVLYVMTRGRGLGLGDVKLAACIGCALGAGWRTAGAGNRLCGRRCICGVPIVERARPPGRRVAFRAVSGVRDGRRRHAWSDRVSARKLPLGVDIGTTRLRIAHAILTPAGPRIDAVAVRDFSAGAFSSNGTTQTEYLAAIIEDATAELNTRERCCVAALGEPDAMLRTVRFPRMSPIERARCARFEAARHIDFPIEEAAVRIHPLDESKDLWAVGIARNAALTNRTAALKAAKLRPVGIDHEASAFARVLPNYEAVLDVGYQRVSLHVFGSGMPVTMQTFSGGSDITRAIERDLSIDELSAEKRKRILGTAGAGERARTALCADIAALIHAARQSRPVTRIALVGNAARLPGLTVDLEAATGAICEMPVSEVLRGEAYLEDVVRSSAPDWTLAAALAVWGRA